MEELFQSQLQVKGAIHQLKVNFKKDGQKRKTTEHIKRRLDTLDMYWDEFHSNHEKLCAFKDPTHDYFTEKHYEKTASQVEELRELIQKTAILKPTLSFNNPPPTSTATTSRSPIPQAPRRQPAITTEAGEDNPSATKNTTSQLELTSRGNLSKIDEMLRKQKSNFRAFSRTLAYIKLESVTDKWELEDILKMLNSRWAAIDALHWEIDSELDGDDQFYEETFTKHEMEYASMKKNINSKLWSTSHREQSTPRLDIPVFYGQYQQWVSFKDLFTEAIHSNPCLSNAQKMQFLKSKIKGEPERLIQHLPISSENYTTCWEILNHRYNNKKLIFTTHINNIMTLPVIQQATASHIKRLHDVAIESLNGIKNLSVNTDSWDPILVHILTQKIDSETHNEYMASLKQPRELPSLKEFLSFMEGKFTAMESSRRKQEAAVNKTNSTSTTNSYQPKASRFKDYYASNKATSSKNSHEYKRQCPVCQKNHGIYFCINFKEMPPGLKRKTIEQHNLCSNCLFNHNGKACNSVKRCQLCNGYHNTILHDVFATQQTRQQGSGSHVAQKCNQQNEPKILLATAILKVIGADGQQHEMRALIDQGSQISLISENSAQRLGLSRQKCKGVITGVGTNDNICKGKMQLQCSSNTEDYTFNAEVFIMKNLTRNLPNSSFSKPTWDILGTIPLADPHFFISNPVDLLLGAEVYANIILKGIQKNHQCPLIAQETRLGWILCGKVQTLQCNLVLNNIEDIQRFWQIEDVHEPSPYSAEEEVCIEFYKSTTTRLSDGKYQVRIPLKPTYERELGHSKHKAIVQFKQLERKFDKNTIIAKEYKAFIQEYLSLGHMTPSSTIQANKKLECFLPHHCVLREDSLTTALRVVFNASCRTSTGMSLNDFMYKGPNLQKDLFTLILKWRQHCVVFIADIEKMFRQIWVHEDDQKLQKIIWRDSPYDSLREYQLTTVTYGTKAAPFLAMMTLQQLASDERSKYPEAAKALEECFYMDDLLHGSHSISSAKQLQQDLKMLLKSGGFNLRKWMSNRVDLLQIIDKDKPIEVNYNFKEHESRKTLGLNWDPTHDNFNFKLTIETTKNKEKCTKRQLLSDISKLFDPLGWLTPLSTKLKLLFQSLWQKDLKWDDKVPDDVNNQWTTIKQELNCINEIKIPRWLNTAATSDIELHAYSDASTRAYSCVCYCKTIVQGETKIVLVAGKSRLVPNHKTITLPRLELCGALLSTKLVAKIKQSLNNHNIKLFGWVDSTAVLGWIQGDPSRWQTFVANRVHQITEVMPPESWRYVKSAENPADSASRGLTASQLKDHTLWWQGPTWLSTFNAKENKPCPSYITDEDAKKQVNVTTCSKPEVSIVQELLVKYSSFSKIKRILAWVCRFLTRKQDRKTQQYLTLSELKKAEALVIKQVQETTFAQELQDLKKKTYVSTKSKILDLHPFTDEKGCLRVGGRLKNAFIPYNMKHPIILPHKGRITELIINQAHEMTLHGGPRTTLSFIRNKYWIIGGNKATKQYLQKCVICKKKKPNKHHQIMGDLPAARCNPSRPFFHTGVDYTGHIYLKANKGRGIKTTKGYVAVFVCMVTKAVHLELVSDLTTSAFIAALRRMAARRGTPSHMYSDNGRNFLGAGTLLKSEYEELRRIMNDDFMAQVTDMEITWHFNAPAWPSAGGLWEAAVKGFKFHLKRVIGEQKLTYEEFSTLLSQIEGILNSRPLCAISEDPNDLDYLTPAHFLTGGPTLTLIETEKDLRTRWQLTQRILQDIWKRWRTEYMAQLNTRSKWRRPQNNLEVNDVVLIQEENLPPGKWAMGRVTELHPGQDGYVRVVSLKTKNGIMKCPVIKLSVLYRQEIDNNTDEKDVTNKKTQAESNKRVRSRKVSKAKVTLTSMLATLMLLFTCIPSTRCDAKVTPFKKAQGLYFDKVSDMSLIRDEWKLIVYYNMNPYWQATKAFYKYTEFLTETCDRIKQQVHCDVISLQLRQGLSELEYYNQLLLNQHTSARPLLRQRRGLIDGVGYVANSLFGVLDERFADQYHKDIQLIQENAKHMLVLWKNQTSIVEAEYNLLKRTEDSMSKQHKMINQHMNSIEQALNTMKDEIQVSNVIGEFNVGALIASNMLHSLKSIQNMLLDTITDILLVCREARETTVY